jgi:hypothetical protein
MTKPKWIIVDVGCIECGEQTEIRGVFNTLQETQTAFDQICKELDLKEWEPRGGFLEALGLHEKSETTYIGGTGYYTRGQRALEVHKFPPTKIRTAKEVN